MNDRDCETCKHYKLDNRGFNACESWDCKFEAVRGKNISDSGFLCSVCGFGDFDGFHGYKPKYCPNCGAKMEGEQNE